MWPQMTLNLVLSYGWCSDRATSVWRYQIFSKLSKSACILKIQNKLAYWRLYLTTTTPLPFVYDTTRLLLFFDSWTPPNDWIWGLGFAGANQLVKLVVSSTRMIRPTNKTIYILLCAHLMQWVLTTKHELLVQLFQRWQLQVTLRKLVSTVRLGQLSRLGSYPKG